MPLRTLFTIPGLDVPVNTYGFMIMLGFLVAVAVAARNGKRIGVPREFTVDLGILAMVTGFLGAKVNYMAQYASLYDRPWEVFAFWDHGLRQFAVWGAGAGLAAFAAGFLAWRHRSDKIRGVLALALGAVVIGVSILGILVWKGSADTRERMVGPFLIAAGGMGALVLGLACAAGTQGKPLSVVRKVAVALCGVLAVLVAGRAAGLSGAWRDYSWDFFTKWQGGFVYYGGVLTAVACSIAFIRLRGHPVWAVCDQFAAPLALGTAFGRVGCFFNGCCHGIKTALPWGVPYGEGSSPFDTYAQPGASMSPPVHPTQLYESVFLLFAFFTLQSLFPRRTWNGQGIFAFFGMYAVWRFLVEFIRGDPEREQFGNLSLTFWGEFPSFSQWVSAAVLLVAGAIWAWRTWKAGRVLAPVEGGGGAA